MFPNLFFLLIVICFTVQMACAQTKPRNKNSSFHSVNSIGLLNGSDRSSLVLQSVLGASISKSFVGIGIGLDYYRFRSIPVFVDLKHDFGKENRSVFLYADMGYNFDWLTEKNKQEHAFLSPSGYQGGIYYDGGVGYKIGLKKPNALLLSAGYSFKRITNKQSTTACPVRTQCFEEIQEYTFSMPRLVIKAGWKF